MVGKRLSDIRKAHGDTQAAFASQLGVSLPTVRAWEQEKSSPNHEMLVAICNLYQISADYLLGLSDEAPAHIPRQQALFTQEELHILREFEAFLLWRKKGRKDHNAAGDKD